MDIRREQMVTSSQFLRSTRKQGIKVLEGVCEIIDNSFDAGCSTVKVHIENNENGTLMMIFTDDGVGIPTIHEDKDGIKHQGIPYVLTYGGRIPHPHTSTSPVGKFGWGLSATASCLSSRTEVYSKNQNDMEWRYSYYDFKELEKDPELLLPLEEKINPPYFQLPETGTIICMKNVDNSEYKKPSAVHNLLVNNLGRIYRYFIFNHREIIVSSRENNKPKETKVKISDPMMLLEGSKELEDFGSSVPRRIHEILFDNNHPLGPIYENDGSFASISTTFTRLDAQKIRKKLDLPKVGAGILINKKLRKAGISSEKTGYSLIRNGREIANSQTLNLYGRDSDVNYFRGEIRFSEALDNLFKIRTNKSRYSIDMGLKEIFEEFYNPIMNEIVKEHRSIQSSLINPKDDFRVPSAERIVAKSSPNLMKKRISNSERKIMDDEINNEIGLLKNEVEEKYNSQISEIKVKIDAAINSGDKNLEKRHTQNIDEIAKLRDLYISRIDERFEIDSIIRKEIKMIGTGEIFDVKSLGDQAWISINNGTSFYKNVYKNIEKNPDLVTLIDLMIFSMGYAEHTQDVNDEKKLLWENARREVSALTEQMVGSMSINLVNNELEGVDY